MPAPVAALYVRADGPYPALVADWWDEQRDARLYAGPLPVVAHPPCARWGRFWWSDGSTAPGNDGGCFAAAIDAVRRFGGVLEHPEASIAWARHDILRPSEGTWSRSLLRPAEWVTVVDQYAYGHRARKRTWLVYVGHDPPPPLKWVYSTRGEVRVYCSSGPGPSRTAESRRQHFIELMGKRERELTPLPFAELLIELAKGAR